MVLWKLGLEEDNMQYFSFDSVLIGKKTKKYIMGKDYRLVIKPFYADG